VAKRLAKLGDTIMGGVAAFVPEHCGKRPRACIQSDADFGSGAASAERRPAAARRLAATLPWVRERTAYAVSGTARACASAQASLARIVRSACSRTRPGPRTRSGRSDNSLDCTARTMTVNPRAFAASSSLTTHQTSQPGSSALIAMCTAAGYRCRGRRRRRGLVGLSGGFGWSRRTPTSLSWS
jgi:hypothetical protein